MAWTEPRVWIDGPFLTAAQMNAVSDNLRETAPAKAQARGDIFYASEVNNVVRLPIGNTGQILTPWQGVPAWRNSPSPVTTQGDLVVGDSSGNPVRFPAGPDGRVLVSRSTGLFWEQVPFGHWENRFILGLPFWPDGDAFNTSTFPSQTEGGPLFYQDLSISGTIQIRSNNLVVVIGRRLIVAPNTRIELTARRRTRESFPYPTGTPGLSTEADRLGSAGCGAGSLSDHFSQDRGRREMDGANGSIDFTAIRDDVVNNQFYGGGGSGFHFSEVEGNEDQRPTANWRLFTGNGGGMLMLVFNEIVNGGNLTIDASGRDGRIEGMLPAVPADPLAGLLWGAGGGGLVMVVARTGTFPRIDVSGGTALSRPYDAGSGMVEARTGQGGNGSRYRGQILPWQ